MRIAWSLTLVGAVVGCGLISSDITALTFELPAKSYRFDTQMANLPSGPFPEVACGAGQPVTDCCAPPQPLPQPNCTDQPLSCDANVCTLHQPVSVSQRVNLGMEVPQLQALGNQMLADVRIKKITYTVASTLNVPMPAVTIYLAPDGVMDAADPSAKKFGTVPATPAGATQSGDLALEPDAQQTFSSFASSFTTPFGFIAATTIVVASGSTIPSGAVNISVAGTISAQPHL